MRVLITNLYLANNSGSEVVVELLADGLRRAGHQPMILAATLGPQAARMRERGHIVVDRVGALPDQRLAVGGEAEGRAVEIRVVGLQHTAGAVARRLAHS